ncbi:DUF4406 domain-containing protein [Branchiibius sp. NY16-3462-2]|uniref:DUF4406 domain-containing protein n=1 Tax=Branchiibius sp. NY16-3462-2 TaxID=1807500 RepID=UPI000AEBE37A|nr:DUF4406 domain-containing protein [Branchiibius sp. NY16-3462-2]
MSRLYIAGPMTGLPQFNYPVFNEAARRLRALGHTVFNPAEIDPPSEDQLHSGEVKPWAYYMRNGIRLLVEAEAVALLPGWESSKGATLERSIAVALQMDVRDMASWLSQSIGPQQHRSSRYRDAPPVVRPGMRNSRRVGNIGPGGIE